MRTKIQAALLSLALMVPSAGAFATTRHHVRHGHHYSRTRGTVVGAVGGALIGGKKGAIIGAVVGNAVQAERTKKSRHGHY
jgi:hypothetical protein